MKTTIQIQNLKCAGCENTILKKLDSLEGIDNLSLQLDDSTISLNYLTEKHLNKTIKELAKLGYPVTGDRNSLGVKTKSYLSCALGRINK